MKKGKLVILSAPSGTGKTSICKELLKRNKTWKFSVSATTREKRKDEVDGVDLDTAKEALRLAVDSHYVYNDASDKDKNVNNVVYEARQCFGFATDLFKEMLQFIKNNEKRFGDGTTK